MREMRSGINAGERIHQSIAVRPIQKLKWCRERDLNPYEGYPSGDFKSPVSAIPPSRRGLIAYVAENVCHLQCTAAAVFQKLSVAASTKTMVDGDE